MRKRHKKNLYRPYVRRMKTSDTAEDWTTALRLATFQLTGGGYVLKQRGFKRFTMSVGASRQSVMESIAAVGWTPGSTSKLFRAWSIRIRNRSNEFMSKKKQ